MKKNYAITFGILMSVQFLTAQITYTFTNCGATGNNGPTQGQVTTAYASTTLAGLVTIGTQGIQQWTVPGTANYHIAATGASGGCGGGMGAKIIGDFNLTQGQVILVLVGQSGLSAPANVGNGGGGGTYVVASPNTALCIAGGGGGTGHNCSNGSYTNISGTTGTSGLIGQYGNAGAGGIGGGGGGYSTTTGNGIGNGGGGGGFNGNGGSFGNAFGGMSFLNGGVGGLNTGGFGGGGGSDLFIYGCGSSPHGGSGGGGYSGGGGGGNNCNGSAGGGGSYNNGTNQSNTAAYNSGMGQVIITTLCVIPTITASASLASVCVGSPTTLTASGGISYSWMPGNLTGASVVVTPTSTTTYTVTGLNAQGCSNTAMITINVISPPVVTANSTAAALCAGSSVTLTGGGASTYTWNNNVMNAVSFVPTATNTYTVTGTDANGCTNTATTTVTVNPLPVVTATSSAASVCVGGSVTLNGGGASSYTWNNNVMNAISFVPTATTTYMVTGTDANGCVNTATITVTVNPLPTVTANSSAASVCAGSSVTLTGGGASTYTWNNNVMNAFPFIPTATNTYMVTGTDVNGCVNTALVTVSVNPLPIVSLGPNIIQCGGTAMLNAGNMGSTYMWSNASTTQTITVSASGTYIVFVTDVNGCIGTNSVVVTINSIPSVTASASSVVVCVADAIVTLTGTPTGGVWSGPGVSGSTFSPTSAGVGLHTAIYSYTDANGCEGITSVNVQVNACVGLAENILANGVSVYPNPNNGSFTLSVNANVGALTIKITDMQGRVVYASIDKNVNAGFVKQISLDTQSSGMYLMHILANGEQRTEKIAVQK